MNTPSVLARHGRASVSVITGLTMLLAPLVSFADVPGISISPASGSATYAQGASVVPTDFTLTSDHDDTGLSTTLALTGSSSAPVDFDTVFASFELTTDGDGPYDLVAAQPHSSTLTYGPTGGYSVSSTSPQVTTVTGAIASTSPAGTYTVTTNVMKGSVVQTTATYDVTVTATSTATTTNPGGGGTGTTTPDHSTVYVATSGSDANDGTQPDPFRTIAHALSVVDDGGTVQIEPGTYAESVLIDKPVMLASAQHAAASTIIAGTSSANYILKIDSATSTSVQNLTFDGSGASRGANAFDYGIWIADSGSNTPIDISGVTIRNVWSAAANAVEIDNSAAAIHDSEIYNADTAVTVDSAAVSGPVLSNANSTVKNNNVHNVSTGVRFESASSSASINRTIFQNVPAGVSIEHVSASSTMPAINAVENYWGSASGPMVASNANGTGSVIPANVTYSPWLCTADVNADTTTDGSCSTASSGGGSRHHNGSGGNGRLIDGVTLASGATTPTGGQVLGVSTYYFTTDLTIGSTGADVSALQQILIDAGYLQIPAPTGYFGTMTQTALGQWQAAHNISPTAGYFGPITRAAMNAGGMPLANNANRAAILAVLADILRQALQIQAEIDDLASSSSST